MQVNNRFFAEQIVQNLENGVQDTDNFVPFLDENDQNMDESVQILDSIPNSTINTKVHSVQSGADGQQQKKENIPLTFSWYSAGI